MNDHKRIAAMLLAAPHTPKHPSYAAFVRDTLAQWEALRATGFKFTRVAAMTPSAATYADSAAMFADIARGQLRVDTAGQNFAADHPLAATITVGGEQWTVNEIFRAVHDVLGHGDTLTPFETFEGETQAYLNHKRRYSDAAIPALYAETMGQLHHYFAGKGFLPIQRAAIIEVEL